MKKAPWWGWFEMRLWSCKLDYLCIEVPTVKRLLPVALALVLANAFAQAKSESITSVDRFESGEHCFVTTVTVEDDGTSESKTVKCEDYDQSQSAEPTQRQIDGAREFAETQRRNLADAGSLIAFHQVIGLDPKIKWYPDLRLKALQKLTAGKTLANVAISIDQLDRLDMYRFYKSGEFYTFLLKTLRELGQEKGNKAIVKSWVYKGIEGGDFQYFEVTLDFNGAEIKKELAIYAK